MNPLNTLFDPNFTPKIKSIIAGYTGNLNLVPLASKTLEEGYRNFAIFIVQQSGRIERLLDYNELQSLKDRLLESDPKKFAIEVSNAIRKTARALGMPEEKIQFRDPEKMFEGMEEAIRDRDLCALYGRIVLGYSPPARFDPNDCHAFVTFDTTIEMLPLGPLKAKRIDQWLKEHVEELKKVHTLFLNYLGLRTLPEQIRYFTAITSLEAEGNRIETLPQAAFPNSLKMIDLSVNRIKSIARVRWPDELEHLYLRNNRLIILDCANLPFRLTDLSIWNNPIKRIVNIASDELINLIRGQGLQISFG